MQVEEGRCIGPLRREDEMTWTMRIDDIGGATLRKSDLRCATSDMMMTTIGERVR